MSRSEETAGRRRLSELIGLRVELADGRHAGFVQDVRLRGSQRLAGLFPELVTDGLVIGPHPRGTLLGYDRRRDQGPALVRWLVRARHRHSFYAAWESVADLDTEHGVVRLRVTELPGTA